MVITTEIARNICTRNNPQALTSLLTKAQLTECYVALYGIQPRQSYNTYDLSWACWQFVQDEIRTADLCKLLH